MSGGSIAQREQPLRKNAEIVEAADGRASDVVPLIWFASDKSAYPAK